MQANPQSIDKFPRYSFDSLTKFRELRGAGYGGPAKPDGRTSDFVNPSERVALKHHLNRRVGNFIEEFGVEALAARIGVHSSAVYHWAGARVQLKQEHARALQSLARESGVSLSLDEIYFLDDEGREKLQSAREQRKMRVSISEEDGKERFDTLEAGLDFARGYTGRLR